MTFQRIPAGIFQMGSRGYEGSEEPKHWVTITRDFYLGTTPVTDSQFAVRYPKYDALDPESEFPVVSVNWWEAVAFCKWINRVWRKDIPEGYTACLPSEAQWEYACRAGTETEYYNGDGDAAFEEVGWSMMKEEWHSVKEKQPNAWGLYDMHGSMWEWCRDAWDYDAYKKRVDGVADPEVSAVDVGEDTPDRVVRGGAWDEVGMMNGFRSAFRRWGDPGYRFRLQGFRVCLCPLRTIVSKDQTVHKVKSSQRSSTGQRLTIDFNLFASVVAESEDERRSGQPKEPRILPLSEGVSMSFQFIPRGNFVMGSRGYEICEEPPRLVNITYDFYLGTTPVTQEQLAAWDKEHENCFKSCPDHPAENLDWDQAVSFCDWINKNLRMDLPDGYIAALPSEAQWEYACRAGTQTEYYSGDGENALEKVGWYGNPNGSTQPVKEKEPNSWGLYDMHGNVWEWCRDAWSERAYKDWGTGDVDPEVRPNVNKPWRGISPRVLRGGAFGFSAKSSRAASRDWGEPSDHSRYMGFRICLLPIGSLPEE